MGSVAAFATGATLAAGVALAAGCWAAMAADAEMNATRRATKNLIMGCSESEAILRHRRTHSTKARHVRDDRISDRELLHPTHHPPPTSHQPLPTTHYPLPPYSSSLTGSSHVVAASTFTAMCVPAFPGAAPCQ